MKHWILLWTAVTLIVAGCGDGGLMEEYTVAEPRILAVKIQDPETAPGSQVSMRMIMGGKSIDQTMSYPIEWFWEADPPVFLGTSRYNEDFIADIPDNLLTNNEDQVDVTILAKINIAHKSYLAQKKLRVTRYPLAKNPVIPAIEARYKVGSEIVRHVIGEGDVIYTPSTTSAIALTAHITELKEGENEQLIFRWYASDDKNGYNRIYAYQDKDRVQELLGEGVLTAEYRQSVLFSLTGNDHKGNLEHGVYDIYLVVRDNAADSITSAADRFGTNFIYFTLCVNTDC